MKKILIALVFIAVIVGAIALTSIPVSGKYPMVSDKVTIEDPSWIWPPQGEFAKGAEAFQQLLK